jgi:hypothetical protein
MGRILWTTSPLRMERTGSISGAEWKISHEDGAGSTSVVFDVASPAPLEKETPTGERTSFTGTIGVSWPPESGQSISLEVTTQNRVLFLLGFDPAGKAEFNGKGFMCSFGTYPHQFRAEEDQSTGLTRLFVDGTMVCEADIPAETIGGVRDGLRLRVHGQTSGEQEWPLVDIAGVVLISASAAAFEIYDQESTIARIAPARPIFTGESFMWKSIPPAFWGKTGLRTTLDRRSPLRYHARQGGFIYAALWTWDYGFLDHLPEALRSAYNGWTKTDQVATVARAPEPFDRLPIYRRFVPRGDGSIDLDAYVGQWVVLGFSESPMAESVEGDPGEVIVSGARARHNVVEQGQHVSLESTSTVESYTLYHDGAIIQSGTGTDFEAPTNSGRYALRVKTARGEATLPLTIALRPPSSPGWERGFFPIHFYNGYSYAGQFFPNHAQLGDLQTLAMFEMGTNTFFLSSPNELVDLLHARTLLNLKDKTIPMTRRMPDAKEAEAAFDALLVSLSPVPLNTLGLYVEDEPPLEAAARLSKMTVSARSILPGVPLLYTTEGERSTELWKTAGSDARMTRAYPIRKSMRRELRRSIENELSGFLSFVQKSSNSTPIWLVVQAFGDPGIWKQPSPAQLRLMVNLALARGVRGLTYFVYDSSPKGTERLVGIARWPFVPQSGLYGEVKNLNEGIAQLKSFLASTRWSSNVPQYDRRFDVQVVSTMDGKGYAWITNWDTERSVTGKVSLKLDDDPIEVTLGPGCRQIIDLRSGKSIETDQDFK